MRLTHEYQKTIKQNALSIFGLDSKVILFGSRVDDTKKGGDIDLYVIPNNKSSLEKLYDQKIDFLSQLQLELGEQKIDVIISKDSNRSIEQEAFKTGVEL